MHRSSLLLIPLLSLAILSGACLAQPPSEKGRLDQAIRNVEKNTNGQVLSAEKRRVEGQDKYRIKVLTPSGRVRIIHVDAK